MATGEESWEETLLAAWTRAQDRSVVGPGDPRRHLELARELAGRLSPSQVALDLGSGAGIPGLALAGVWAQSTWVLVDAAHRRVALMEETVRELGWEDRVSVVHGRAEDLARGALRGGFDLVTARSFGPPAATAECGVGFLQSDGILAVTEPPGADGSRWPAEGLSALSLEPLPPQPGLQQLRLTGTLDGRYPRRPGVPSRRPLF